MTSSLSQALSGEHPPRCDLGCRRFRGSKARRTWKTEAASCCRAFSHSTLENRGRRADRDSGLGPSTPLTAAKEIGRREEGSLGTGVCDKLCGRILLRQASAKLTLARGESLCPTTFNAKRYDFHCYGNFAGFWDRYEPDLGWEEERLVALRNSSAMRDVVGAHHPTQSSCLMPRFTSCGRLSNKAIGPKAFSPSALPAAETPFTSMRVCARRCSMCMVT